MSVCEINRICDKFKQLSQKSLIGLLNGASWENVLWYVTQGHVADGDLVGQGDE